MIDPKFFDDLSQKLSNLIPSSLNDMRKDFEQNIKSTLQTMFAKLDLVTREEFDVQTKLLQKTVAKVAVLEEKIRVYEQELSAKEIKDKAAGNATAGNEK